MSLEETTGAEIEQMKEQTAVDKQRLMTGIALFAVGATLPFVFTNLSVPQQVTQMNKRMESLATKADVDAALESSREYTDKRVSSMESSLAPKLERMITIQETIRDDVKEGRDDRKGLRKDVEEVRTDVARVRFAVESE